MEMSSAGAKRNENIGDPNDNFTVVDEVGDGQDANVSYEESEGYGDEKNELDSCIENNKGDDKVGDAIDSLNEEFNQLIEDDQEGTHEEVRGECNEAQLHEDENDVNEDAKDKVDEAQVNLDKTENLDDIKIEEDMEDDVAETVTHPYAYLIDTFEFPNDLLNFTTVGAVKTIEEKPFHMVNNKQQLQKMLQSLRNATEIAVDIQVDDKEFNQPICLISMADKDTNYIIDCLRVRHELLQLTEIFINPKIVKIICFADYILKQLQQKLHLYMINIFDVVEARNGLFEGKSQLRLSDILNKEYSYKRVRRSFKFDFKSRPLSEDIKTFCQAGVHYLIYIYHDYKNKFLTKSEDEYKKFLSWCRETCKKIYSDSKKVVLEQMITELQNRHKCELEVLKALFHMRNRIARKQNVKPELVMSKGGLMTIVKELPTGDTFVSYSTQYLKDEWFKIKKVVSVYKEKFHIPEPKIKKKKAPNKFNTVVANKLKRKLNDSHESPPQKQRFIEQASKSFRNITSNKKNNSFLHNKNQQRRTESTKKSIFSQNNTPQQGNFNIPSLVANNFQPSPFLSQNNSPFINPNFSDFSNMGQNSNKIKGSRFEPADNRQSEMFVNNPNMNRGTFSLNNSTSTINPTDAPSSLSFQSNSFSQFNESGRMGQEENFLDMLSSNFNQRRTGNEQETLYRSLVDLKQARENLERQSGSFSYNYGSKRMHDLKSIDQKITHLERQVRDVRERNKRNDRNSSSSYRRRY